MSFPTSPQYNSRPGKDEYSLKREEWAIINNYKAIQFEKLKEMQKVVDNQKKRQLKQDLENQLHSKKDVNLIQREEDRKYYNYITKVTEQQKARQERSKIEQIIKRKNIQHQNQYNLEHMRISRQRDNTPGYNLEIGLRAEMERRKRGEQNKKDMLDTLDKQMQVKDQEKKYQKVHQLEEDQKNLQYQFDQFDRRGNRNKNYAQNPKVYDYYRDLQLQRMNKQRQLQHRIIDEAALKKKQEDDYNIYVKADTKRRLTDEMKNTLNQQIQYQHYVALQKGKYNPEDNNYSVIGGLFRPKPSTYDKRAYSEYLKRQAEEQTAKKNKQKYMSEEEYRFNVNQLNKAINGNYAYDQYIDRSIGAIGDSKKVNVTQIHETVHDQDGQIVKKKLENIKLHPNKTHNTSGIF